jgi:hypothetical protein
LIESEKERHAEGMSDEELVLHVESKLRPLGESLLSNLAYIREARERFAHPGRRVPVSSRPTFTEWIRQNLGISDRHVRRLLAAAKEPADRSREDEMEQTPKQHKRDEVMWQAGRLAHSALGLGQPDEPDPSGEPFPVLPYGIVEPPATAVKLVCKPETSVDTSLLPTAFKLDSILDTIADNWEFTVEEPVPADTNKATEASATNARSSVYSIRSSLNEVTVTFVFA